MKCALQRLYDHYTITLSRRARVSAWVFAVYRAVVVSAALFDDRSSFLPRPCSWFARGACLSCFIPEIFSLCDVTVVSTESRTIVLIITEGRVTTRFVSLFFFLSHLLFSSALSLVLCVQVLAAQITAAALYLVLFIAW